ncbi:MAG: transcription elongation factor GreA [bacterium]
MKIKTVYLTRAGLAKKKRELDYLQHTKRREVIKDLAEARAHGDLSENAEYDAAKEAQAHTEKKIAELVDLLSRVRVIEDENIPDDNKIYIGSTVRLIDLNTDEEISYRLLSEYEADISNHIISTTSPIGKALLGHEIGDEIKITVPSGVKEYEIVDVSR